MAACRHTLQLLQNALLQNLHIKGGKRRTGDNRVSIRYADGGMMVRGLLGQVSDGIEETATMIWIGFLIRLFSIIILFLFIYIDMYPLL